MDTENETIQELVSNWIEASGINSEWKAIKDTGLRASTDGHTRCKLVIEMRDGLSHYQMQNLISLKSVVDAANGDPERNNAKAKIYNYDVGKEVLKSEDPEVFASSEGYEVEDDSSSSSETYEDKLDSIRDSYELIKAKKEKLGEDHMPHIPIPSGADALRKAREGNDMKKEKKLREAKTNWEHAVEITNDRQLSSMIQDMLVDEVDEVIEHHF
jgi:hypothetical protein